MIAARPCLATCWPGSFAYTPVVRSPPIVMEVPMSDYPSQESMQRLRVKWMAAYQEYRCSGFAEPSVSKQTLMRLAHDAIAFARLDFKTSTVADSQITMLVLDGACPLKSPGRLRDARPPNAKHQG